MFVFIGIPLLLILLGAQAGSYLIPKALLVITVISAFVVLLSWLKYHKEVESMISIYVSVLAICLVVSMWTANDITNNILEYSISFKATFGFLFKK